MFDFLERLLNNAVMPYVRPFPNDFFVGQRVQLLIGGMPMMIEDYSHETQKWLCMWVNEFKYTVHRQHIKREWFATNMLKEYRPPPIGEDKS